MSNFEKAVEVLREAYREPSISPVHACDIMATALEAAGLLMPDLPEPDNHDEHGWPEWGNTEYKTYFSKHPCKGIPYISTPLSPWMDAESVREEAYRLLSAAEWLDNWDKTYRLSQEKEHAEKEQDNE